MTTPFQRTRFTAGKDAMYVSRHYMTGGQDTTVLNWDEAAELYDWLGKELEKRENNHGQ